MSTQGRRGGTRRRRTEGHEPAAAPIEATIPPVPAATTSDDEAELLEERTIAIAGAHGRRLGRSLAGAMFGTLLVAELAFGAALGPGGALGPKDTGTAPKGGAVQNHDESAGFEGGAASTDGGEVHDGGPSPDHEYTGGETDETSAPDATGGDETGVDPGETGEPASEPAVEPEPDATPRPEPKPDPTKPPAENIALSVWIKELKPVMEWGSCAGLDFDYYKVVRSKDSTVTWPLGENDTLIAVVEPGGTRKAWDSDAPPARKAWYRVFCVRHSGDGYKVLRSSATRGVEVPEAPAPPDPITLDLDASISGEGQVVLSWSACNVDGFGAYKVLRSTTTENPSYKPWTNGTEVIGVVEDKGVTEWNDAGGDPGQTVYYRVQCLGWIGGSKVLLGQTAVVAVAMP